MRISRRLFAALGACAALAVGEVPVVSSTSAQQPPAKTELGPAGRETPQQRLERMRGEAVVAPETDKSLIASDPRESPRPGLKRLSPDADVWVDPEKKQVVVEGEVVLRRGPLELLACLKQTKEHEAVVSCSTKAYFVHAALLAVGATPGNPARFTPEFVPARGTEVDITAEWLDASGKRKTIDARKWLKNVKTGKALEYPWVFGGSGFWTDPMTGKEFYQAEDGDFICVSNFPTALLDLPVESPQANAALMFEAFTENIPPEKTKVTLFLTPKLAKPGSAKPAVPAEGAGRPATKPSQKPAEEKPAGEKPAGNGGPGLTSTTARIDVADSADASESGPAATAPQGASAPRSAAGPSAVGPSPRGPSTRGPLRRLFIRRP